MTNNQLLERAKTAATNLYANKTVSVGDTLADLQDLRDHIEILIDAARHSEDQ